MVSFLAFVIIVTASLHGFTEATLTLSKPKGTIKTIKSDDGDVIDCVDIYKQPAFNNPFVKSSQIDYYLEEEMKKENTLPNNKLVQDWHKYGECPFRTIPILRSHTYQTTSVQAPPAIKIIDIKKLEHAMVWSKRGEYYGASAKFSVWDPVTETNDFSLSKLSLVNNFRGMPSLNTIESGWHIYPEMYGDRNPRFFIYSINDHSNQTGCYNDRCRSFVQISRNLILGFPIGKKSLYNKISVEIQIHIYQDIKTGHWMVKLNNHLIGYWPEELFHSLKSNASHVSWGGEVYGNNPFEKHTNTQMGSGHFSNEGYLKASHIRNLEVMVKKKNLNTWESPHTYIESFVTNPNCYSINIRGYEKRRDWGLYFYYGGPGFSAKCP